jgi:protein O-GlcNAc transferase
MNHPAFAAQSHEDLLERAAQLARKGRWQDAARLYRALLAQAPDQPDAWEGLGLAALHANQPAEGLRWLLGAQRRAAPSARLLISVGIAQRRNGLLHEALATFQQAYALDPGPGVLLNRARTERQLGLLPQAIATFEQALALERNAPETWSMLSNALREAGRLDEALGAAREALARDPWFAEAHLNEGVALHRLERLSEASVSYWVASTRLAQPTAALSNLNKATAQLAGRGPPPPEVELVWRLLRNPRDAALAIALGHAEQQRARVATAIGCFERAAELAPSAAMYLQLGMLVAAPGRMAQAEERMLLAFERGDADLDCYRRLGEWLTRQPRFRLAGPRWASILERCPDDVPALVNLGAALQRQGLPSAAARLQERALALEPQQLEALLNYGAALSDQGHFAQANASYRRALEIAPGNAVTASNLLFSLHFDPSVSADTILAEHRAYGQRFGLAEALDERRFAERRDPERRLRIGYVSPDLRWHPVAYFLEPVLRAHAASAFDVYCYSDAARPDDKTAQLAQLVPHFIDCRGWSDADLARHIAEAEIDILVDLAGHTARNRLLTFARKPAPLQLSWLGYFDTTGLAAIDYRIADAASVSAEAERWFVERVVRLPRSSNCFAHPEAPQPSEPPCLVRGQIRFGCFNNPAKLTRQGVATFARVLRAVEGSRMLLKYGAFDDPQLRARYQAWFREEGIAEERIEIQGHAPLRAFLSSFSQIDIALDPFPYSGETTALHTLWMGVPLVALEGTTLVQRLASRVLRVAGLPEWVARSEDEYVAIACALAHDPAELARRRAGLRAQLLASPLCDHAGVTRELEELYRRLWREWCVTASRRPACDTACAG